MNDQALLRPGERIDDLQFMNLRVIQSPDAFRFGMDSVLLADFAGARRNDRVCDLGTGSGILPLLLFGRQPTITCDAVEIQPDAADRAARSMALNRLADRIQVHCGDIKNIRALLPHAAYHLVICNPPYSPADASLPSPNPALRTARQEGDCTLADVAAAAQWLLKYHGRLCLVLPSTRLTEAFDALRRHRLEPKRLRLVHARADRPARLALIEALLDARPGLSIDPPLLTQTADGGDTDEIKRIYHQI
ncbi:MAG: tRNA1(Val) (adenine(37)-N6)-methyltransferase [Clostridia bacterium]|nr:tRNA1(Val) (adenine(37)-N6)-methyltransferase [Clostridia bacterium]